MHEVKATIREGAVGPITFVLSTLYGNPSKSSMREYVANALDAHIDAGVTHPVQITLPTPECSELVVRDFGNGLDRVGLEEVFFAYGESTKTGTNDQVGYFGLGAKSAFSIASTWTVTSIHEGKRYTAAFALDENDVPVMRLITDGAPVSDTEESGITVAIPVKMDRYSQGREWRQYAEELTKWFPKDSVDFGHQFKHWSDLHKKIGNVVSDKAPTYSSEKLRVLMGGILYNLNPNAQQAVATRVTTHLSKQVSGHIGNRGPLPSGDPRDENSEVFAENTFRTALSDMVKSLVEWATHRVVEVPLGSVNLLPSREELRGNDATITAISDAIIATTSPVIDKLATFSEPVDKALRVASKMALRYELPVDKAYICAGIPVGTKLTLYAPKSEDRIDGVKLSTLACAHKNRLLITGVPGNHLPFIRIFMKDNGYTDKDSGVYYTSGAATGNKFLDADLLSLFHVSGDEPGSWRLNVLTYSEYRDIARECAARNRGPRVPRDKTGSLMTVTHYGFPEERDVRSYMDISEIADYAEDSGAEVYHTKHGAYSSRHMQYAEALGIKALVVSQGRRKVETLEKYIPGIGHMESLHNRLEVLAVEKVVECVSPQDIQALRYVHTTSLSHIASLVVIGSRLIAAHPEFLNGSRFAELTIAYNRGKELRNEKSNGDPQHPAVLTGLPMEAVYSIVSELTQQQISLPDLLPAEHYWPLAKGNNRDSLFNDPTAVKHLAMYLAMVG